MRGQKVNDKLTNHQPVRCERESHSERKEKHQVTLGDWVTERVERLYLSFNALVYGVGIVNISTPVYIIKSTTS